MRIKPVFPLSLSLVLTFSGVHAQMAINFAQHMLIKISDKTLYGDPAAEKVEGTPFLNEIFVDGVVYDNAMRFPGIPMRYNMYDDQIEFKQNNQLYILDPLPRVRRVELEGHVFVVDEYEFKGKTKQGFFLLLDSGKVTLLSKKMVIYREQQPPKGLDAGPTPAKYSSAPDVFYFKIKGGAVEKVESIKKMIAGFPDKQTELIEFAKKEKISPKKEEELIKLVRYYNSL
jgi:hypothetical protein